MSLLSGMLNLTTVWQALIRLSHCLSISVFEAPDSKNSLTCSRKRGSPLASRFGPVAFTASVAFGAAAATAEKAR